MNSKSILETVSEAQKPTSRDALHLWKDQYGQDEGVMENRSS